MNRTLVPTLIAIVLVVLLSPGTVRAADDGGAAPQHRILIVTEPVTRPAILTPLYVSLAALETYDGYSTLIGVRKGAQETNGLVGGLAGKPAAFWAVKGGSTALTILLAERLWRNHRRVEAITMMVVSNGLMAAIAARNASVLHASR